MDGLTPAQVKAFNDDGFLIIPDALTAETVESLLVETHSLLDDFSLDDHPMTKFSTGGDDGNEHVGDDYFLESGDKIHFFFEEDAFDSTGKLKYPKSRAINKIGHSLHTLSPPFSALLRFPPPLDAICNPLSATYIISTSPTPSAVAASLGFTQPEVLQSMIICKQPSIGGAVPPHQDSVFLYTAPPSAVGFWYALEDATVHNGCLSVLRGSHKWAPIEKRFVRRRDGTGTEFVDNDGPRFPAGHDEGEEKLAGAQSGETEYEPVEVKAGTLVLIHGNLLHKSEKNVSDKGRIAYTFHVIEGEGTVYDERNWLKPPKAGFTKI